jgi:DNA ligase D-like protein (predicted 3'-phosphoesterase)
MHPEDEVVLGIDPAKALRGWERPVYMVHDHHSRSHHYDLRLEFDGVLRSWAVPKGLSTEPGVRRLAMQVPDHALSYAPFEGTIPEGSYGAGKVDIWDRGTFKVLEQAPDRLVLDLRGRKVSGVYHLVRAPMRGDPKSWLVSLESKPSTEASSTGKGSAPKAKPSDVPSTSRPSGRRRGASDRRPPRTR